MVMKRCRTGDGQPECRKAVGMYFFKVLIGDFHTKLGTDGLDMTPRRDQLKSRMRSVTAINGSSTPQEAITPPGFVITMSTSSVNKCWVHAPADFAKRGILTAKHSLTLRDASHRSWPVHFIQYPSRATFTKGWSSFVKENHLVVGDICVFKLVTGTDDVLEVSISRAGSQPSPSHLPA